MLSFRTQKNNVDAVYLEMCIRDRIRPVLCLERKEIDNYLIERGISFVEDSTNLEDEYTRNKIRHHILPVMEREINRRTVSHMAETAELLGQAEKFLKKEGATLAASCKISEGYLCLLYTSLNGVILRLMQWHIIRNVE